MKLKISGNRIMLVSIGLMLVIAAILYPSLPEELPRQWGFDGQVNSTWHKFYAVLIAPIVSLGIWILTYILPKIDPNRESYEKFGKSYMRFRVSLVLFFLGMHIITLTQYDNADVIIRVITFGISIVIAVLGNEMGRFRQTWFVGIRTPWTLADERVWKRTHRVGGRYFFGVGIICMIAALILPTTFFIPIFVTSLLAISLGTSAYSYFLYRKING